MIGPRSNPFVFAVSWRNCLNVRIVQSNYDALNLMFRINFFVIVICIDSDMFCDVFLTKIPDLVYASDMPFF